MEDVNGAVPIAPAVEDKGAQPPPSPLTGCYLLLVVAEPYTPQHKDIILQRIAKGLLSWNVNECLVDLEKELAIVTEQALEGEEARYGERLIQFASENLVTEILIHPVVSTLAQCMRNLLSSFTKHRHIIHAGYTFAANGSWALQDGTFSYTDFAEAFQELDVQRVIRAYENGITIDLHCSPEGDWIKLPKEQFTKACKVRVNPSDVLTSGSLAINNFINYISPFMIPTSLECLLESSDVVGNIRFSRPTLYVFPGGQGDAALFGINGFNMLLDGGYARKACFWDFVRHLDRLDAVLMTRLNNSNVGGISSVLRRKKQDALYPQIGHFFCNLQERKALLSPDGDKDRDPLLINLLDEGQEIVSNLRHLHLTPQVCYRDSEPINLYHKVGHGTLDMYILSPSKDSKEVREFLHKWNQSDLKLFANAKSSREFSFPLQNLVSVAALLVWQPADPDDTITRILFPGSCPQAKVFEGLDRLKSLEFVKSAVCTEKSLSGTTTKKTAIIERIATKDKEKIIADKKENKIIENNIAEVNIEVKEKTVKKSDSTESDRSIKQKKIEDHKMENGDRSKPKPRPAKPRSDSQQRRKPFDKKVSPKKVPTENGDIKKPTKPSPVGTPAKSAKDASNRRVIESKVKQAPPASTKPSAESKPKVERKPISRRPKAMKAPISPVKKLVNGIQKPDSISKKGRLDKEGTTDSSTVSTPSMDQESVLKKDISKLTPEELQQLKAQELADLKEEQEAVKEIEAVFRKGEGVKDLADENLRKVKDVSIDEDKLEEKEEYLIIEKEEIQQESQDDKERKEDETQKLARDSEESEKQRKPSVEEQRVEIESQINGIVTEAEDILKSKDEHVEVSKVTSPEDKGDSADKKVTDKDIDEVKDVAESQPDEKVSVNIKSGDTTTAPTLPEDERIPLDEIKEDNGQAIEEKHVKEDTKEKEVPVIQLPPKPAEIVGKVPSIVGIKLDKQSHIRDIVKTPDEVADLPVHEEADFEYTQDVKAETAKTNEIVEDKKSGEKVKSKEETKMVESEKDSDELAQKKPEEVVPQMKEELKHLTDTVIKTELKTDTLGDKAMEDNKVEDQIPKEGESDKKAVMDQKDIETKIDIVEKQEEEEHTTKEKSPEIIVTMLDIDIEKESSEADEQKGELPDDLKAESKGQIISKEDEKQDSKIHTELHGVKTDKHDDDLKTKLDEKDVKELVESDESIKEKGVGKDELTDQDKDKKETNLESSKSPTLHGDYKHTPQEKELDKTESDKFKHDVKSKDEKIAEGKMSLPAKEMKKIYDTVIDQEKRTESKTELELNESKKTTWDFTDEKKSDKKESVVDHQKTPTEKVEVKEEISRPQKVKDIKHEVEHEIEKREVEKDIDVHDIKPDKKTHEHGMKEEIKDHEQKEKEATTPIEVKEVISKPQKEKDIKHEAEHEIEKKEDEKDIDVHDTKLDQKSHEPGTKEEMKDDEKKEKDTATAIEMKEEISKPQKEKDIKHEAEHEIEKREDEKDIDVHDTKPDKKSHEHGTKVEIKDDEQKEKDTATPIEVKEEISKPQKEKDIKHEAEHEIEKREDEKDIDVHDTKPDQKSHEHETSQKIKDDEKKEKDTSIPIEVKDEISKPQKEKDIKHEAEHEIEKREVEKDIDVHDTKPDPKSHEHVTKKEIKHDEQKEDTTTPIDIKEEISKSQKEKDIKLEAEHEIEKPEVEKDIDVHDKKPDQKLHEHGMKEEIKDHEQKEKEAATPIEVKEEVSKSQKEVDIKHEVEHKIEKREVEKDIDVHDAKPEQKSHEHETSQKIKDDEKKEKDTSIPIEVKDEISKPQKEKDIKHEAEHEIEKREVEKNIEVHDTKPEQKSHEHGTKEEIKDHEQKEKDTATPIEVKEEVSKLQKEVDIKHEAEHELEKREVEKDIDVHDTKPDKKSHEHGMKEEIKEHEQKEKETTTPIEVKEEISKSQKEEDIKHEAEHEIEKREVEKYIDVHDSKPEQKSHEHETSQKIKDDEKKEKDTAIPIEVKGEMSKPQKEKDIKHEAEHEIEKREVEKDIDVHDTKPDEKSHEHGTKEESKDHEQKEKDTETPIEVKEEVSKLQKEADIKHEVEHKIEKREVEEHETSQKIKDDEKKEKDTATPIELKEEISIPQKEKDLKHEVDHKIEKREVEKDIDVSEKQSDSDLPEPKHTEQEKSTVVGKQLDVDISKDVHSETKSGKYVGEEMQNGVDAVKPLHYEDIKSTREHADLLQKHDTSIEQARGSHIDDKKSVVEGKQKEIDAAEDQQMEHEKSIIEDKQKDTDITREHKKLISEIEKIELGRTSPMDLGRKSPKEREEDVIKIVASVAEVLKSDAPLEEFEGKLPIDTFASFTSELRETHITTLDSPSAINGEITSSFIEEEKKHETETTDRRSSLLKESRELMMATSKMISDIKTTKTDEKEDDEEVGTVHRMLVTASSEDGGEETEICPPGSIIFSRSSESSGRSSPEHSQKLSQKSSTIDTASESLSTIRPAREQEEKDSGIDDIKSDTELPDQKSAAEKDSGRESPAKKAEDASIKTVSGKSTPDKDASIKSIASGKSSPDISDLEQSKDTDELRKTEEEMSIEAVETTETQAAAKRDSTAVQDIHVIDESKKIDDTKLGTDLDKVEDVKTDDRHTKEQKEETKDKEEELKVDEEFEYIRDVSPKDLEYDASKVENDKTPEKSHSKTSDQLKKEIDELQDSFIEAVSKETETPRKSSISEDDQVKKEAKSKIDLDDKNEKLLRKSSLKADEILKKEIQEVQENFIDSVAKDAVMADEIDADETSPKKMSPTDGRPIKDEILEVQEFVRKDSKPTDDKQHSLKEIEDKFEENLKTDMTSKSVFKQTDEFLRKEIEAVQGDFIESLSEHEKPEKLKDEDGKASTKLTSKADELLKEEIKQLQESFVDGLAEDTLKEETPDKVESKIAVKDEMAKKDAISSSKEDTSEGVHEATVKTTVDETIHIEPQKTQQLLKKEIDEVQEEFIESVSKDFKGDKKIKQDLKDTSLEQQSLQASEQLQHDIKDIKEEQIETEEKISYHMLPKAEFPEKIVDPTKATDKDEPVQREFTPPRRSSSKASELLKEEIKEVQDGFVESIAKDIADETKAVIDSVQKIDEKLPFESIEIKKDVKSGHHDLETDIKEVQGESKKDTAGIDGRSAAAQKDDIEEGHKESLKKSSKTEETLKGEIEELQQTFIQSVASDIKTSDPGELRTDKLFEKIDETVQKEMDDITNTAPDSKHVEIARKSSFKSSDLLEEEIKQVQEGFIESVSKDLDIKRSEMIVDPSESKTDKLSEKADEIARKASLKADDLLKEEIKKVEEGFIESLSKDVSAKEEQTKDDKYDTKSSTGLGDMLKKGAEEIKTDVKESGEDISTDKDLFRKPSLKEERDIAEVEDTFIKSIAKDPEAVLTDDTRRPSSKAEELLKDEINEVHKPLIDTVAKITETGKKDEAKKDELTESHSDVEPPQKKEEAKDTTIDGSSADRKSSLTTNGLIKDTKSHQEEKRDDAKAASEKEQVIKADEIKKEIQEIQDEFIESVAEDFVLIDRIKKDKTADQTDIEEAKIADELDSKRKSSPVKEKSEKTLEKSATEIADTFDKVTDMTKSVMFDKCETSAVDPAVVKKDEEQLEKRADNIEDAYETVTDLAKSISFEKVTDKFQKEAGKVSMTDDMSKSMVADDTDTSKIDQATIQKDETISGKQADGIKDIYETVSKLEKSITFGKVEENDKTDEATLKQDEELLNQKASDIEDAYETVSQLAKSIPFDKVEGNIHIDQKTLKKDERLLEERADDIEDAYDTVTELAKNIPFKKVESTSHIDQAVIEHDENVLEQTAGDVEKAYETVTKLAKRISFEKVEDKSEKDKVTADVSKHTTTQEHKVSEQTQESKENKVECVTEPSSGLTGTKPHFVESKDSEKHVADEKAVEKERKGSISQPRKESLTSSDHGDVDTHIKTTLEVTQSRSEAKKLSISEVEILLTGDKSADDEKQISGTSTPPTVPVSPNIKEASGADYTESAIHLTAAEQMDPMCMSFYGSLPEDEKGDEDIKEGEVTHLFEITKAKFSTPMPEPAGSGKGQPGQTEDQPSSSKDKDSAKSLGKPLGLPSPPYPTYLYEITTAKYSTGTEVVMEEEVQSIYVHRETDMMNTSFYGSLPTDEEDFDPLRMWGKPLGLPSPAPPNDNKGTPKKERKLPSNVSAKNKLNDDKKRAESPSKHNRNRKNNPIYVDLTYVPHHGNTYYAYVDFFKRIRARYYVFSGIEPSREVYNALLEAKQTWEDKELEVTIIPTYDTDVLGYWVAENEDLLAKFKIDLSPSASRCTINLQDHETSCSAYRLEF